MSRQPLFAAAGLTSPRPSVTQPSTPPCRARGEAFIPQAPRCPGCVDFQQVSCRRESDSASSRPIPLTLALEGTSLTSRFWGDHRLRPLDRRPGGRCAKAARSQTSQRGKMEEIHISSSNHASSYLAGKGYSILTVDQPHTGSTGIDGNRARTGLVLARV